MANATAKFSHGGKIDKVGEAQMLRSSHRYRGYVIGLEWRYGALLVSVSPATPDLPILHRRVDTSTQSEAEAMVEAKNRVDRALSNTAKTPPMSVRTTCR